MGRNTEIYQFDKEKASTALYEDLQRRTFYKRKFSEFLKVRREELDGYAKRKLIIRRPSESYSSNGLLRRCLFYLFNKDEIRKTIRE